MDDNSSTGRRALVALAPHAHPALIPHVSRPVSRRYWPS